MNVLNKNLWSLLIGAVLTSISYIVAMHFAWIDHLDWLEISAVFTSYVCTVLCVWETRTNYIWGAVSVVLLTILFYEQKLYSSAILNAYLAPTLIWGWYRWKPDNDTRPVSLVSINWWPAYLLLTFDVWYALSSYVKTLGGALAGMDSFILAASILAQFLLDQKKLENWFIWSAVNVVAIYTYSSAGLYVVAIQYIFFLLNSFYGIYMWLDSYTKGSKYVEFEQEI